VITYEWRGGFTNEEISARHAEVFGHEPVAAAAFRRALGHNAQCGPSLAAAV
jgi:hypothetical protein